MCRSWTVPISSGGLLLPHTSSALECWHVLILRARTLSQMATISFCAPLLMSAAGLAFSAAIDSPELRSFARVLQLASIVSMAIAVASALVALSWAAFWIARKLDWVASAPPNLYLPVSDPELPLTDVRYLTIPLMASHCMPNEPTCQQSKKS